MTDEEIKKITKGYFSKLELECRCGICSGECDVSVDLLEKLLKLRVLYGKPIFITSGYRCKKHMKYSANHNGYAVDILCEVSGKRFKLIDSAIKSGFTRIGIDKKFIHVDCNPGHNDTINEEVIWVY